MTLILVTVVNDEADQEKDRDIIINSNFIDCISYNEPIIRNTPTYLGDMESDKLNTLNILFTKDSKLEKIRVIGDLSDIISKQKLVIK